MSEPGCIFCQIVAGEAEAFVVASGPTAVAFLDISPLALGHTLVVPTRHHERLGLAGDDLAEDAAGLGHQ